jgi:hypothetical protein
MQKIKIQKESEETTYKKITEEVIFKVNDKEVRVYVYSSYDSISNDYEDDTEIDTQDYDNLTELEGEYVGENLQELLDLKVGEIINEDLDELDNSKDNNEGPYGHN